MLRKSICAFQQTNKNKKNADGMQKERKKINLKGMRGVIKDMSQRG